MNEKSVIGQADREKLLIGMGLRGTDANQQRECLQVRRSMSRQIDAEKRVISRHTRQ